MSSFVSKTSFREAPSIIFDPGFNHGSCVIDTLYSSIVTLLFLEVPLIFLESSSQLSNEMAHNPELIASSLSDSSCTFLTS